MVLEKLGESLRKTLSKLTGVGVVDEKLINEIIKDVQRSLLLSDVNVKLVLNLSNRIRERVRAKPPAGLTKKEQIINVLYEELAGLLGGETSSIQITKSPFVIMLVGLFGNGKTTTAAKLAKYFQARGKKVALISTDTYRPAAYEQLRQLASQIGVDVFGDPNNDSAVEIYSFYKPQLEKYDVVICDTAGRDALSDELVEEIKALDDVVNADEKLLVIAADIGQSAEKQARMFHDAIGVTGVIITKLDGTAKGGGALSACAVTGAKVKFIGVGEKIDALEQFKPKNFVSRLLGMGDLESLLEKAKLAIDEDKASDLQKKFLSGEFNLYDLREQMESVKKMGSLSKLIELIPGFSSAIPKEVLSSQEGEFDRWKVIMDSMTPEEMKEPEIINSSRIKRIALGSGQSEQSVRSLIKHYRKSRKMMKLLKGKTSEKQMQKLLKRMGGKGMPNLKF